MESMAHGRGRQGEGVGRSCGESRPSFRYFGELEKPGVTTGGRMV